MIGKDAIATDQVATKLYWRDGDWNATRDCQENRSRVMSLDAVANNTMVLKFGMEWGHWIDSPDRR